MQTPAGHSAHTKGSGGAWQRGTRQDLAQHVRAVAALSWLLGAMVSRRPGSGSEARRVFAARLGDGVHGERTHRTCAGHGATLDASQAHLVWGLLGKIGTPWAG